MKTKIKPQLTEHFDMVEVYDNGCNGDNEVAHVRGGNGADVVIKVMLANKKYHQRRKALTEATMYLLDKGFGGERVVPDLYVELFTLTPAYIKAWGIENAEGHRRVCSVIRGYAPGTPGDEWRGEMYFNTHILPAADAHCKNVIDYHPDAERISILDFITINQDRSARNWVTDHGRRFYAIDNGMAWFHEYPESDDWKHGCVIDNVILQVEPWQFISGVFTTSWAGRALSPVMQTAMNEFDELDFLQGVESAARDLGFPAGISEDWRFEGLLRRLRWMGEKGRQPTPTEYRDWHKGSELMTPPEIVATGGKVAWTLEMDSDIA